MSQVRLWQPFDELIDGEDMGLQQISFAITDSELRHHVLPIHPVEWLEAIASRLEAIALRLEAIAI